MYEIRKATEKENKQFMAVATRRQKAPTALVYHEGSLEKYLAVSGKKIVGTIAYGYFPAGTGRSLLAVSHLAVEKGHKGAKAELIQHAVNYAKEQNFDGIAFYASTRLKPVYEELAAKHGFTLEEQKVSRRQMGGTNLFIALAPWLKR